MNASALWSRSRSKVSSCYRRCRCYTCLAHPDHAISLRRPTPISRPAQWRKLTTLFYSSLFATAAAADVQCKQSRRDQWDAAISAAEEQVHQGRTTDAARRDKGSEDTIRPDDLCHKSRQDPSKPDQYLALKVAHALESVGASLVPIPYGLQGRDPGRESIYASDYMHQQKSAWTPKKLAIMELAMAKLVLQFSMAIPNMQERELLVNGNLLNLETMLHSILRKIEGVKKMDTFNTDLSSRPGLPQYTPSTRLGPPASRNVPLDATLRKLTESLNAGDVKLATFLTTLSQTMLASRLPPEVSSMTIILDCLSMNNQHKLADVVCDSIMDANMRLDEDCTDAIVNHYISANDEVGFNRFTRKMKGYYGGLALARNVRVTRQSAQRLRRWNGKVTQGIEKDAILYRSVIRGQLVFGQIQDGVKTLYDSIVAGFGAHESTIRAFIKAAAATNDWQLGDAIRQFALSQQSSMSEYGRLVPWDRSKGPRQPTDFFALPERRPRKSQESQPGLQSNNQMLRRQVQIIAHKAHLENIRYQRRARLVVGTEMRLAGHSRADVLNSFREVAETAQALADGTQFTAYLRRVKQAKSILREHGPWRARRRIDVPRSHSRLGPEVMGDEKGSSSNAQLALMPAKTIWPDTRLEATKPTQDALEAYATAPLSKAPALQVPHNNKNMLLTRWPAFTQDDFYEVAVAS